jgi:deoxyribose-phosphate aldolase
MTSINTFIDHTKLGSTVSLEQIDQLIQEGLQYQFKSLCVNTHFVSYVSNKLKDSNVLTCTVIGFPHGSHTKEVKAFETNEAIQAGADEIDMVINNTFVKAKDYQETFEDIKAVVNAAKGKTVKVILETCYLTDEEIIFACQCAKDAGANFVKTSTGFGSGGATFEHVKLMKQTVRDALEVKASGGIRNREDAMKMIEAGATRLGTSKGVEIMENKEMSNANTTY